MSDTAKSNWALYVAIAAGCLFASVLALVVGAVVVVSMLRAPSPAPTPTPAVRLASLVPDADARGKLRAFFGDFAAVLRSEAKPLKTTGQFRDAYRLAVPTFQGAAKLSGLEAIDKPVADVIGAAIGKADAPLDGEPPLRSNLANALDAVAEGLR